MLKRWARLVAVGLLGLLIDPRGAAQVRFSRVIDPPAAPAPVVITLLSMPSAVEDIPYPTQTVTATGGTGPYTFAVTSGTVPTGLTFSTPTLSGTPTTPGVYTFRVTATDTLAATGFQDYSITITASTGLPFGWSQTDIGTGQDPGNCTESAGAWTCTGAGITYETADQGHFAYQTVSGDKEIIVNVSACSGGLSFQCGVMMRAGTAAGAVNGFQFRSEAYPIFQWRPTADAATDSAGSGQNHNWQRLVVIGATVTGYYGDDSVTWTQVGATQTLTFSGSYQLGLYVNSNSPSPVSTATFLNVTIADANPPEEGGDQGGYLPHYQGYGANTVGGRTGGSRICEITSLADEPTGAWGATGSARDCLEGNPPGCQAFTGTQAACARYVFFGVSGRFQGQYGQIAITGPYLTIAGQTAPSGTEGSCSANCTDPGGYTFENIRFLIDTHDVVVQHVRVRKPPLSVNALSVGDASDGGDNTHVHHVAIDHVSVSWANQVNNYLAAAPGSTEVLIVDSMFYEGLWPDGIGGIGAGISQNSTVARNVFAHHETRQPIWGAPTNLAMYNNVTYNGIDPGQGGAALPAFYGTADGDGQAGGLEEAVLTNNVILAGPDSGAAAAFLGISKKPATIAAGSTIYMQGNTGPGVTGSTGDGQWTATVCGNYGLFYMNAATCGPSSNMRTNTPPAWWTAYNFQQIPNTGTLVRDAAILNAGARPQDRDSADERILGDLVDGGGTLFLDWDDIVTNYGGFPTISQRTRPVTINIPANPDGLGTCGTFRTRIECWLYTDPSFGSRRLEEAQGPPSTNQYLGFFQIRYGAAGDPQPQENGVPLARFTIDGQYASLPSYKYLGITYGHWHVSIGEAEAAYEAVALTPAEITTLFNGAGTIRQGLLQEADIAKIQTELNPTDPPLAFGAQRNGNYDVLYDMDGFVIPDSPSADYRNGLTIIYPADYVTGESRTYWNLNTPAVVEYLTRYALQWQSYDTDARLFLDEAGTYGEDLFARDHVWTGSGDAQAAHLAGQLNTLLRQIRTRVDPAGRVNQGLMPNPGFRQHYTCCGGSAYWQFWNIWYPTLITTDTDVYDSIMIENVWNEVCCVTNVAYYRDKIVALNSLGKTIAFVVSNYPFLDATDDPHMEKIWLWLHLVAQAPGTVVFLNPNSESAMLVYDVYSQILGNPLEDPYLLGDTWYRRFDNGEIIFNISSGSITAIEFIP